MKYISIIFLIVIGGCSINHLKSNQIYFIQKEGNLKNKDLQELLQCDENKLTKMITPFIYSKGKKIKIKDDFNLDKIKKALRNDTLGFIPYWKVEKSQNLVLIMSGLGLWDIIWGYVLVNSKTLIIENIVFCHKAETPGLGAEISKRKFEEKFIGLKLISSNTIIITRPEKENKEENPYNIDGISGATITCDGLNEMINLTAKNYAQLLIRN